jgi:acetyl-CoA acetyltransferase
MDEANRPRGRVAVVGAAATEQGELPGRTSNEIAVEALGLAIKDAGIRRDEIDGLITCKRGNTGIDTQIGAMAGLNPRYSATLDYGTANFSLHLAVMAIESGLATTIALTYGTNQRTAKRSFQFADDTDTMSLIWPYGFMNMAGVHALGMRRRQHLYGETEDQIGHIPVVQRRHAQLNPLAVFQKPLTIDDYLASRYIVQPLRRPDICMVSDGGAAFIVTSAERAATLKHPPAYVLGMSEQAALRYLQNPDQLMRGWAAPVAAVFERAGVSRTDVDLLLVQDVTSLAVLEALELYGYCGEGEAGAFVAEERNALGSDLPVNTGGGELSESYLWGWMHLYEAVIQLRGVCGPRQVGGAKVAHFASNMGYRKVASTILGSEIV